MKLVQAHKLFHLFKVKDKSGQFNPLHLWPSQLNYIQNYLYKHRKIIVLKARQKGFTLLHGIFAAIQISTTNFRSIVISKGVTEATEFLEKVRLSYEKMDDNFKNLFQLKFQSDHFYSPITKGEMISLPSTGGRSFTCDQLIIDEASFVKKRINGKIDLADLLASAEPTIEKMGGQVVLLSTADGIDYFQKMYKAAVRKENSYTPFFFSCFDDPTFSQQDRDLFYSDHGEDLTNQEYPIHWIDAFLSSGSPRFDKKSLQFYSQNAAPVLARAIVGENGEFVPFDKGALRLFHKKKPDGQYLISADVAEGLERGDYSVAEVIDRETGQIVAEWHGHIENMEFGNVLVALGHHYNNAILAPETGVSKDGVAAIIQIVRIRKYPTKLIHQSRHAHNSTDDDYRDPLKRFGWETTSITRPTIINNFASMLVKKEIPNLSEEQVEESYSFIRNANGRCEAEGGSHDDRVMAMCIGYYLLPFYPPKKRELNGCCTNCKYYFFDTKTNDKRCRFSTRLIKDSDSEWCGEYSSAILSQIQQAKLAYAKR